ncbi:MAG: N-acetyltransferase family protein [Dehalococcoidia bacterium]|nr:N-acetyltransferase family protein [Dehalococcoidia bacterium]
MVRRAFHQIAKEQTRATRDGRTLAVRQAEERDIPAIMEVFNQGVEDGVATFDLVHSQEQTGAWFLGHGPLEPILIVESDGLLVGWASLSRYSPRMCYDTVKELSVYVRREWRQKGVGSALVGRLLRRGAELGLHKVVLFVSPLNRQALNLYRRHEFRKVGVFHRHGVRNGVWLDIIAMERFLDER